MNIAANNSFGNQVNMNPSAVSFSARLWWYFKRLIFVGLICGSLVVLQIFSLEIPNRYSIFPLYGFYAFSLVTTFVLLAYLIVNKKLTAFSKIVVAVRAKKKVANRVPAVTLKIRRKKSSLPNKTSATVSI